MAPSYRDVLTPRCEGAVHLPDGRRLGYAEYGDPNGRAVFWFPGTPGARRQVAVSTREFAARAGVRLVAVERPGAGLSTPHRYGSMLDFADDVAVLADRLGVDRFACVGLSGGGPYVLACAHAHPDRMVAGAVLGGVAPAVGEEAAPGGVIALATRFAPFLSFARGALGRVAWFTFRAATPFASQVFDLYMRVSPPGDQLVFSRPEMKAMFIDDLTRAYRGQAAAPFLDIVHFTRDWGFRVRDIAVPVRFWHGDADHIVPLEHAHHLRALVPDSELRIREGESHLGALDAADEIIGVLLDLWDLPAGEVAG